MKRFIKLYWPMAVTFLFLVVYGIIFGMLVFGEALFYNDAIGIFFVVLTLLLVIGIYGEIIYFIIKAANDKKLNGKVWWCVGLYCLHIFLIPYFNLKHVCGEKKVKGKMIIFSLIAICMFVLGFFIPNIYDKGINNQPLIINYDNKVNFIFPSGYVKEVVGEYDIYAKDRERMINFGGFVYDEDDSETVQDVLNYRDSWIKTTRGTATVLDEYYKELDDKVIRGTVYVGINEGVKYIYYIFSIEFNNTDTFVNVIAVNLYEDYLDYKDELLKIFEDMEYFGIRKGL